VRWRGGVRLRCQHALHVSATTPAERRNLHALRRGVRERRVWHRHAVVHPGNLGSVPLHYVAWFPARKVDVRIRSGFNIRPAHFVERHGGLLIVAFGESLVAVGMGVGELPLNLSTIATAVLGLVIAAALWWAYFAADQEEAKAQLHAATLNDRIRMALVGYFYAFVPMLLGITSRAAGVKLTISTSVRDFQSAQRYCWQAESHCTCSAPVSADYAHPSGCLPIGSGPGRDVDGDPG
jgi:hypothetical protein